MGTTVTRCHMKAIVLRACRKWISFRVAGTCRRSSPPDSWGWTGQEHEQRSGSHPSSPPGLPTLFPTTFSSNFLGSGFQNPDSLRSNTKVAEKLRKCPSINCSRFFLYSGFLRRPILIHNKPVEIGPRTSPLT